MKKGTSHPAIERSPIHHDPSQVALLTRIIVVKHGADAPRVAGERLRRWIDAGDEVTASLWTEVAKAATDVLSRNALARGEPPLNEVLDDAVTRQVMDADGLSRDDVTATIGAARQRVMRRR